MRLSVPRLLLLACALACVVPTAASAASYPVIKKISPLKLHIGETMTITGHGFRKGKGVNTIVFQRTGQPAVFVTSSTSTKTKITVKVPAKLASFLATKQSTPVATRFRIRVLARRFSKSFTSTKLSPVIEPAVGSTSPTGKSGATPAPALTPLQQCQAAAAADFAGDQDADGMPNGIELAYGVDPCNPDTDGDGITDGYEYESARDLNAHDSSVSGRPYPGSRPWPNPLDPSDAGDDFDGDGLTMGEEYTLWRYKGGTFPLTQYSDGSQSSGGRVATFVGDPLDLNHNGSLTDDERDADGDGLSNIVELHVRGPVSWWSAVLGESPYVLRHFAPPSATNPDSDGDGVLDGADDQDDDGYSNVTEMQLRRGSGGAAAGQTKLLVQPYNPCLPNPYALVCSRYIPVGATNWRPFTSGDQTTYTNAPIPLTTDATADSSWDGVTRWDGFSSGDQN
jgi:IPT/TIG domain-containing protein